MTVLAPLDRDRVTVPAQAGLRSFLALLWRRKSVLLFVLVLVGATVAAGLTFADREYTATARVAATPPPELSQSPANYVDLLGTMADVAESGPLLQQVAEEVGGSAEDLRDHVSGEVVPGTVTIQVSVDDPDPERAAEIANAVVEELPDYDPSNGSFLFSVTEPADPPRTFSSPNIPITILAGIGFAILVGIGSAVLADRLTRTVDDAEDVREVTDTPVLGIVPAPTDLDGVPATGPVTPEFQALRSLRVGIEFASSEEPTRLVVAAPAGEDGSGGWLEVNLAAALAEVGHRVLLIDADRDAERRHEVLAAAGDPGLYDVLSGSSDLRDTVYPGPVPNVDVLPLGNAHVAAPSLLEVRFRRLLAETEGRYDVVLVHAGPVTSSEDARILAIHGALLLTVPAGQVHPRALQRATDHLRQIRIRMLGVAVIGTRSGRGRGRRDA